MNRDPAMTTEEVDAALSAAERASAEGRGLRGTGFWKIVDAARRDRTLVERYGVRIAAIDRCAFERGVKLRVPLVFGLVVLLGATAFGVAALVVALRAPRGLAPVAFLVGTAALILGTHSIAHWIVGRAVGIRFTHVFLGGPKPPRPGVKTDYVSYLRATPMKRAAMHASGAVVTKIVPFALIPVALAMGEWAGELVLVLLAIGVVQIITDVVLSTKLSDWKKVRRELTSRQG